MLTDTVGFIHKLPHHLIKAFKSTLDEAVYADILMILTDVSDPEFSSQLEITENLLKDLGAAGKPTLYVFNKYDKGVSGYLPKFEETENEKFVCISAKTGYGLDKLVSKLEEFVHSGKKRVCFHIPNNEQGALNILYKNATVENVEYGATEVVVDAIVDSKIHGMLKKYDPEYPDCGDI